MEQFRHSRSYQLVVRLTPAELNHHSNIQLPKRLRESEEPRPKIHVQDSPKTAYTQRRPRKTSPQPIQIIQTTCESTTITIADSSPIAQITIESDEDHHPMPKDPLLEGQPIPKAETQRESTIIDEGEPNIPKEHAISDEERNCQKRDTHQDSPMYTYSTTPSEIPPSITQEQSPILSLNNEDIEQINKNF